MKFSSTDEKKRLSLIFAGYYISSAIILVLLFTVFLADRQPDQRWSGNRPLTDDERLQRATDILQGRLADLQALDTKYIDLLKDSGVNANFDGLTARIKLAEADLEKTIDSVDRMALYGSKREKLDHLNYSCKAVLDGHRSVDQLENALVLSSRQISKDQQAIRSLSGSVQTRDSLISDFKVRNQGNISPNLDARFPGGDYRLLQSENNFLKSELEVIRRRYNDLYSLQNPQDNENKSAENKPARPKLNQSGKAALGSDHNKGSGNTKEIKYDGVPKE
jgi:hypothetical protein